MEYTVETNYPYVFVPCGNSLEKAKAECLNLRKQGRNASIVWKNESGNDFTLDF